MKFRNIPEVLIVRDADLSSNLSTIPIKTVPSPSPTLETDKRIGKIIPSLCCPSTTLFLPLRMISLSSQIFQR